jgi:hypothetical protein
MLTWIELPDRLNADGEFRVAARFWDATLRFDVGETSHMLRIEDGAATGIAECAHDEPADLHVSAPTDEWQHLLADPPRPFYQDLLAASLHHGFEVSRGLAGWAAYYPALRRLVDILRAMKGGAQA